jgi:SAM-dependent methyltransferase
MFDRYEEIFERRGHLYHKAMTLYPLARKDTIIGIANIEDGVVICDVPSGGGYIKNFIDKKVDIVSIETSRGFAKLCRDNGSTEVVNANLNKLPIKKDSVDRVLSLAGLHHIDDKLSLYSESHRILRKKGLLCIADAWHGGIVSMFLDEFVDEHNSMGHRGAYLDENTRSELQECGFEVDYSSSIRYFWRFPSPDDMLTYFQLLFGIDKATSDEILDGITRYLGYRIGKGECSVNWELTFYQAIKQ